MEVFILKSRFQHYALPNINMTQTTTSKSSNSQTSSPEESTHTSTAARLRQDASNVTSSSNVLNETFITFFTNATATNLLNDRLDFGYNLSYFNNETFYYNSTNTTDLDLDELNVSGNSTLPKGTDGSSWSLCDEWVAAQHNLFQLANLFFVAAFLVPLSFKQSILIIRALLAVGFLMCTFWGGIQICAADILLWNFLLASLNVLHSVILTWRFLPPPLTLELTELYLKVFKPLKVSKKHFKELSREASVMKLEKGDIYAVEDVSSADERLSILLKGKLRVTCDDTHLHFIHPHQFVDSPEWESNHENSDDVFQVTITAEEDCTYLCWPRMRLERVLRHRPMLKTVLDCLIGKDITQKLYSLNEHLLIAEIESDRLKRKNDHWASAMSRSLSVDAVHTGTRGHVRSHSWRQQQQRRPSITCSDSNSPLHQQQCWVPLVANHFLAQSPFTHPRIPGDIMHQPLLAPPLQSQQLIASSVNDFITPSTTASDVVLLPVPQQSAFAERKRSFRKKDREVKFEKQVKEVSYNALE